MKMHRLPERRLVRDLAVTVSATVLGVAGAQAFPSFPNEIPNGFVNRCANCHLDPAGGGDRNAFGLAFANLFFWDPSLAAVDSDGDGFTNGEELQDATGQWFPGDPPPGEQHLVSSPGFDFSTPGERGLALSEVLLEPTSPEIHQAVEIQNLLPFSVDATGLLVVGLESSFEIPAGTVLSPDGTLLVVLDSESPDVEEASRLLSQAREEGILHDPPLGGLAALATSGELSLHWIADVQGLFDQPQTMTDYLQWGSTGQPRAPIAAFNLQWTDGGAVATPLPGSTMAYDGSGDASTDWGTGATPTLGRANPQILAEVIVQFLLGHRTSAQLVSPDPNGDGQSDAADAVVFINSSRP